MDNISLFSVVPELIYPILRNLSRQDLAKVKSVSKAFQSAAIQVSKDILTKSDYAILPIYTSNNVYSVIHDIAMGILVVRLYNFLGDGPAENALIIKLKNNNQSLIPGITGDRLDIDRTYRLIRQNNEENLTERIAWDFTGTQRVGGQLPFEDKTSRPSRFPTIYCSNDNTHVSDYPTIWHDNRGHYIEIKHESPNYRVSIREDKTESFCFTTQDYPQRFIYLAEEKFLITSTVNTCFIWDVITGKQVREIKMFLDCGIGQISYNHVTKELYVTQLNKECSTSRIKFY